MMERPSHTPRVITHKWQQASSMQSAQNYLLVTSSEKHPYATPLTNKCEVILKELRMLHADGTAEPGVALGHALSYMARYRLLRGYDKPGSGYFPTDQEPVWILWFTDGAFPSSSLVVPPFNFPGSEMYKEPYRWDQKLYTFLCSPNTEKTELHSLCYKMGGIVEARGDDSCCHKF